MAAAEYEVSVQYMHNGLPVTLTARAVNVAQLEEAREELLATVPIEKPGTKPQAKQDPFAGIFDAFFAQQKSVPPAQPQPPASSRPVMPEKDQPIHHQMAWTPGWETTESCPHHHRHLRSSVRKGVLYCPSRDANDFCTYTKEIDPDGLGDYATKPAR
jgi:hypothetical protein